MLAYRPDIDGLRAIAVLSVLLYHLDSSWLPGGFIGVDVFFVISGYLITKLIVKELDETQKFSFKNFYIRRARRLFPALGFTLAFCIVAAYFVFSPQHLSEFAQSLIYAVFSISNFFFWSTASYFDSTSEYKPLLHTWSLSVEEQFYLLWPLTLVLLARVGKRGLLIGVIVIVGLLSLLLNHFFFSNQALISSWVGTAENQSALDIHATVFYLLPFRVFEFAIGAILVVFPRKQELLAGRELMFVVGLLMVLYSAATFNSKMEFPSFAGLVPCIGAGLMILSGAEHRLSWLTSNKFMVAVGLISYSLYLIHWPIIVFYKYWNYQVLSLFEKVAIMLVSVLLAGVMYKFIEQPFRKTKLSQSAGSSRKFLAGCATSVVLLCGISWNAFASNGWLWRYPPQVVDQLSHKKGHYSDYFWRSIGEYEGEFADNGKPKVLILGDSMAADLTNALVEGGAVEQLDLVTIKIGDHCRSLFPLSDQQLRALYGNKDQLCRTQIDKVLSRTELLQQAETVVLASFWWEMYYLKYIDSTAAYLKSIGVPNVLVMGVKNQQSDGIAFLAKHSFSPRIHKIRTPINPQTTMMNNLLRKHAKDYQYFDLMPQFCTQQGCQRVTEDGYVIIFDGTHMTKQGAELVGTDLDQQPWFQSILNTSRAVQTE